MTAVPIDSLRKASARNGREALEGCSIAAFAAARKLSTEFLTRELAWSDGEWHGTPCVEIPYVGRDGATRATRFRIALRSKDRFRWANGTRQCAYEPDRGAAAREQRYVIVVEGESDTATLLAAGFPAVGVPGASATHVLEFEHVAGLEQVFVVHEPGAGGDAFVAGARERLKELGFAGRVHELRMPDDAKDPSELYVRDPVAFAGLLCAALEQARLPPRPAYLTLDEMIVHALRPVGERLVTGFATLDAATRGGIPVGRLFVLAGAPGSGKSTLAVYLGDCWERAGCAVVYLAADEPAEGILTRLGQLSGWSRDALESEGDIGDSVRAGFAMRSKGRALAVIDPDVDESMATIEDAEQALVHLSGERPRVLVVDSLQTARCAAAAEAETVRERIDAKVRALKAIAKRGTLVVAISEMARSGYRTGDRATDISALAAGKESGSIEYGAALLLGLRSVKGEAGLVDVEVAKNRLGGDKPEFRLRLDFDRASFMEVERPAEEEKRVSTEEAKAARDRERILAAVAAHHELKSATAVSRKAGGNKQDNLAMIRELLDEGALVKVAGVFRVGSQSQEQTYE